jgi:zinc transporter, ZIP family
MDELLPGHLNMDSAPPILRSKPTWVSALVPVALIAILVAVFIALDPIGSLRDVPPVEEVAFERTVLREGQIELHVSNDGPDPVTISQVLVNDAYWSFSGPDGSLGRLEGARFIIPYPWEEGLPLNVSLVTSTGLTIEHEIEAAALTPEVDREAVLIYALLGLYIGVIPVCVGLLWFPALQRAGRRVLTFALAFTIGLLVFLLLDTAAEGLELAQAAPAAFDGLGLFVLGALAAILALTGVERVLTGDKASADRAALALAYLIALGIGLHNMGEGLAVGSALAVGEVALGTFLIVGFAIHNTTEGLAIVAPLGGGRRPHLWHFAAFGAVAGAPTILGAWLGGFLFSATLAALAFGVAAGAIAQVIWQIWRGGSKPLTLSSGAGALGLVGGFVFMYVTGLFAA